MRFAIKLLISVCVISLCAAIGRHRPTLAGLIGVMPLTGLIVLIWLYLDNPGNLNLMADYTKGAVFGITRFFLVAMCELVTQTAGFGRGFKRFHDVAKRNRLRAIFFSNPVGIWQVDADGGRWR